jgi:hypothetical protein
MTDKQVAVSFVKLNGWTLEERNKSFLPNYEIVATFAEDNNLYMKDCFNCGGQQKSTNKLLKEALRCLAYKPKVKYLVVPRMDVLSKNFSERLAWIAKFEQIGVKVVTAEIKSLAAQ